MSMKRKITFYCDEPDCQANQTFVIAPGSDMRTQTPRGTVESIVTVLTKEMDWDLTITPRDGKLAAVLSFCPRHQGTASAEVRNLFG